MKGTISENLEAILRDDRGRQLLRRSLIAGKDSQITIGNMKYRVSTKGKSSLEPTKSITRRFSNSTRRTVK